MFASVRRSLLAAAIGLAAIGIVYSQQGNQETNTQAKPELTWERLTSQEAPMNIMVYRAKVPGGWLLTTAFTKWGGSAGAGGNGVTFVPDAGHLWDGGSVK